MIEKEYDNEIFNCYDNLIPYMTHFFQDDVNFSICDTEKYIKVVNGMSTKPRLKAGDPIQPGSAAYECMKAGKPVTKIVPKEVLGVQVRATGVPVFDENGNIAGCLVLGKSLERENKIHDLSQTLSDTLQQISTVIGQISSDVQVCSKITETSLRGIKYIIKHTYNRYGYHKSHSSDVVFYLHGDSSFTIISL